MKKLTLKTKEGCWRLLAIFLIIILLSSFAARLVSSDGGNVKISRVTFDSRGATMTADLYYPRGTTDKDSLPAVIVTHGAGVTRGVVQGIAEELARRGFVVMNVDAYGAGLSEQPLYDEGGQTSENFNSQATPAGLLDAVNFLRTFNFVDQTRIGMAGHSMGSKRVAYAAMMDCGYLTLNDIMINVLYDVFGQEFSEDEISLDADSLAAERLNQDELMYYETLKSEKEAEFKTRIKSICIVGGDAIYISPRQAVEVAGHEVMRNCQVNFGIVTGTFDTQVDYPTRDTTKDSWYTGTENANTETWYVLDDVNQSSIQLGNIFDTSVANNAELQAAIENRVTRIASYNQETHSRNFFSVDSAEDIVKYFEQTLSYNNGELSDANTVPIDAGSIVYLWRALLNFVAMLAMFGMLFPLASMIFRSRFFASCVSEVKPMPAGSFSKKRYWIFSLVTIVATFFALYRTNLLVAPAMPWSKALPLFPSWWLTEVYLAIVAVVSLVLLAIYWLMDKKSIGNLGITNLNIKMKIASILKCILAAIILLAAAYASLMVIEYLFGEDYRLWMTAFTEMKVEYWGLIWRYALLMFPCFILIGAATNYTVRTDISPWKDMVLTVIVNSLGVWLLCGINYVMLNTGAGEFSNFTSSYSFLLFVPITVYITRKMYKVTNNIWTGAALNSLILAWTLCSSVGYNSHAFVGQSWISCFFNM